MADLNGFDANQVEPASGFDPLPSGKYIGVVVESEMTPNKAGTGHYLKLTFQITEGEFKNRILWARLNLDNPNQTAVQIAQQELSAICRAVGVLKPRDSVELHNLPLVIKVACKKRTDTGELVNEIKAYEKRQAATPPANGTPANNNTPPWMKS
jgi:hypothetical protein